MPIDLCPNRTLSKIYVLEVGLINIIFVEQNKKPLYLPQSDRLPFILKPWQQIKDDYEKYFVEQTPK